MRPNQRADGARETQEALDYRQQRELAWQSNKGFDDPVYREWFEAGYDAGSSQVAALTDQVARMDINEDAMESTIKAQSQRAEEAESQVAALQAELAKCGKENCMGHEVEGCRSWVAKEALERSEEKNTTLARRNEQLEAALRQCQQNRFEGDKIGLIVEAALLEKRTQG
jgi:hypothetical protein